MAIQLRHYLPTDRARRACSCILFLGTPLFLPISCSLHFPELTFQYSFLLFNFLVCPWPLCSPFFLGCDYQADVCWQMSNTIKQTSVGKCQILSSIFLLANLEYYKCIQSFVEHCLQDDQYQANDVNLGFESELKFLSID